MPLSLPFRLRHRLARYSPIPLPPLSFGQGLSLRHDLAHAGITPMTIVDAGANVGQSAYEFACTWPQARVHSFEPVPAVFDELCANVRGLSTVRCHCLALSDRAGQATIHVHGESVLSSFSAQDGTREEPATEELVTLAPLDDLAARLGIDQIDLLKIDVEGHELSVLEGANRLFRQRRVRAILIEVGFSGQRHTPEAAVRAALEQHGFHLAGYHEQRCDAETRLHHADALFILSTGAS